MIFEDSNFRLGKLLGTLNLDRNFAQAVEGMDIKWNCEMVNEHGFVKLRSNHGKNELQNCKQTIWGQIYASAYCLLNLDPDPYPDSNPDPETDPITDPERILQPPLTLVLLLTLLMPCSTPSTSASAPSTVSCLTFPFFIMNWAE